MTEKPLTPEERERLCDIAADHDDAARDIFNSLESSDGEALVRLRKRLKPSRALDKARDATNVLTAFRNDDISATEAINRIASLYSR